ncbi:MAG: efflux RND transporter periplasmic adaptor subunit, partial [Gemmataceae bacterium]|nr:efflux RND transporter periplasmic adaptor subunit [Gemmataceae bacterium]
PAGAVWLRTPQGFLQLACQLNLDKVGLDDKRGCRQCHNELLRQAFQSQPPRPVLLEPNGRLSLPGNETGPVPAANLTNLFVLLAPILTPDKQALGLLEVFQEPTHDPRLYPAFLNYTAQMAGYASQYHHYLSQRADPTIERTFTQIEAFARLIHSSLHPTEVAYHIANEGRKLIECDRLSVGVRYSRKRVTVEAISGADVVEKASTHVRSLRRLMEVVLQWGETLVFKGSKEAGLPPDVATALDAYLAESHPKFLVAQPIRDEREKETQPVRSVLVLEVFNPPENVEPLVQRLEVVGKHAASALYNAAEMKRVPLRVLWKPLLAVQDGLGGKGRFYAATAAVVLTLLVGALIAVPYPLRLDAKGQLLPEEIAQIFPRTEGVVVDIRVRPGQKVAPDYDVVHLYSVELAQRLQQALNTRNEAQGQLEAAEQILREAREVRDRATYETQRETARLRRDAAEREYQALLREYLCLPEPLGKFRAVAPRFDPAVPRHRPPIWTVLDDDRRDKLLGRTVRPHEELLRVGNLEGAWHAELKIPQRNIGHIRRAFADPRWHQVEAASGRKYLDVDLLLSSMPDTRFLGRLYEDGLTAQAVPNQHELTDNEPVVTAYVKLQAPDIPLHLQAPRNQFVTGLEVRTRIRCGQHALGYSLFHGVWEWFYEKIIFFF